MSQPAPVAAEPVRVLYLGGIGRSGSTVLGRMLGSVEGAVSLGEVVHLWNRGHHDDQLCGCGQPFSSCPFWSEVGERAYGGWGRVPAEEMVKLQRAVDRNRYLSWLISGRGPEAYMLDLSEYRSILTRLYQAASHVSGGAVLVDTSKNLPYAWLLSRVPQVDLRVVHLVRDSRGVAYSWAKQGVVRPELRHQTGHMDAVPTAKLSARWLFDNAMFDVLAATSTKVLRVRYEDVIDTPVECLREILDFAGIDSTQSLMRDLRARSFTPTDQHEVSGNPMRFSPGPVTLRPDVDWREQMPARDRRTATIMTAPLMAKYGYL